MIMIIPKNHSTSQFSKTKNKEAKVSKAINS